MNHPLRILLLEDSPFDAEVIQATFDTAGVAARIHRVDTQADYLHALKIQTYDVILLDYKLPDFTGLYALTLARVKHPDLPILFVSQVMGGETIAEAIQQGANDYVHKDRLERLVPAVQRAMKEAAVRLERKRAEEALKENQARLARAEAFSQIMVTHAALDGHWLKVPPLLCQVLGYTEAELLACRIQDVTHPEDRESDWRQYERLLKSDIKSFSSEKRYVRKDGQAVWFDVNCALVTDSQGIPVQFLVYFRDVTGSKLDQEKIREQAALLDQVQDAIIVCGLTGEILFWNLAAERIYGWSPQEAAGRRTSDLIYSADKPQRDDAFWKVVSQGEWQGELPQITKNGKAITVDSRWRILRNPDGIPTSILIVNTDITERKILEKQFLRSQRLENIGRLAGGIAHDLNNILAPIMMSLQLLRLKSNDPQSSALLETLESSIHRGANVVKQILTFARGVEGQKVPLQPGHLLKEMEKIIRGTFPKNLVLHTNVPADLWLISGDITHLHQVLMNLCVNARDAMPKGGVLTLSADNVRVSPDEARLIPGGKAGPYVLWRVADTGIGIAPENLEKIFDPFFTTKDLDKGTGLGLSTVLGIVESHHGFIQVQSQEPNGTEFKIYLPAVQTPASLIPASPRRQVKKARGELLLVVDDEEPVLDITRQTLEGHGYRVVTAKNGAEALDIYARNRMEIHAVLTDLVMPIMDGMETIKALHAIDPQLKIIAASGNGSMLKFEDWEQLGVSAYLPKPFCAEVLFSTLEEVLGAQPQLKGEPIS